MRLIPEINESDFEEEVLKSGQPVLVNFCAARSQPCRIMGPVLEEVAAGCNGRVKVVTVDVDDNPDLGIWYGIHSIPALLCFVNGEECSRIVGAAGGEAILASLQ
jgi:thioredoxin 1